MKTMEIVRRWELQYEEGESGRNTVGEEGKAEKGIGGRERAVKIKEVVRRELQYAAAEEGRRRRGGGQGR